MKLAKLLLNGGLLAFLCLSSSADFSVGAPKCSLLKIVGGEGPQAKKTVTAPSIPISIGRLKRDNWNTDFAINPNAGYRKYIVTLTPETDGEYSIKMFLKYSDNTADSFYNKNIKLSAGKPLKISGTPRANAQPYQVNVFVGDAESFGKTYLVSVVGCR